MMQRIGTLLLLGWLAASASTSAQLSVVVLLRGTVVDSTTGTPVGTEFELRDLSGKRLQMGRSDSRTGSFELVLQPGQSYVLTFRGYNVLRKSDTVRIPAVREYTELPMRFSVRVLRKGMELLRLHAFDPGSTTLRPQARQQLEELVQLLNRNRSLRVSVHVAMLDTRFVDEPAPAKGTSPKSSSRKRSRTAPAPSEAAPLPLLERAQQFLQARADAVAKALAGVRDGEERIRIVPELPPLPIVRPLSVAPTVTVFVDDVRELVE
jgi:hypothetical protein